ncbi:MAG: hypothetical protein EXR73_05545 [Myxococcales bacterium]|nr:hypothetical protein [Myxococcales bacterium]
MTSVLLLPWLITAQVAAATPASPPAAPAAPAAAPADPLAAAPADPLAADLALTLAADTPAAPAHFAAAAPLLEVGLFATFVVAATRSGDAPAFVAGDDPQGGGLRAQELELTFAADVDPYFTMSVFLAIPDGEGVEVEEAILTTTALPFQLQLAAGVLRSSLGRNNEQHLHQQHFAMRPRLTALLGDDGLRGPGAQLSALLPLPWYAVVWAEALALEGATTAAHTTAAFGLEQFFPLSRRWSLLLGISAARARRTVEDPTPAHREWLAAADVYVKWRPEDRPGDPRFVSLTVEGVVVRSADNPTSGASYAELVFQFARRFRAATRVDVTTVPPGVHRRELAAAASLTFSPSEFSRVRLTAQHQRLAGFTDDVLLLQFEAAIGAHAAHPF